MVPLAVVRSIWGAPRRERRLTVSRDHLRCSSSSSREALSLQNSSFSCSKTFINKVRLEAAAMMDKAEATD